MMQQFLEVLLISSGLLLAVMWRWIPGDTMSRAAKLEWLYTMLTFNFKRNWGKICMLVLEGGK